MAERRMNFRGMMTATLLCALVGGLPPSSSAAQQTTRRSRSAATQRTTAARPTPSPTPIVVPRLGPPSARVVDDGEDAPPPPPRPTPTPAPTPVRPVETVEDDGEVIRVSSNLVVVPTSVIDAAGNPVQGLTLADFRLAEEGKPQTLAEIGVAEQVPLDIALIFDVSSSTIKNFDFMKQAAAGFLREVMKPSDRAAIFTIGERPTLVQGLSASDDAARKLTTVPAAFKATGTAFYDTVTAASKYLNANTAGKHRRVVLVLSDGEDNFSDDVRDATIAALDKANKAEGEKTAGEKLEVVGDRTTGVHRRALQNVMREVQKADAVFYSINPSGPGVRLNVISQRAEYGMQQIAESTGGSSFLPANTQDLPNIFRRIAAELRAQYLLQYYSSSDAPPGRFLKILVTTPTRADLKVRARQGYYQRQK